MNKSLKIFITAFLIFTFQQSLHSAVAYITNKISSMDGHVYNGASSGADTTSTYFRVGQGTTAQNYYYHGFFGINIAGVADQNITAATLVIAYNAFTGAQGNIGNNLRLDSIDFGNSIEVADWYGSTTNQINLSTNIATSGVAGTIRRINVSKAVSNDANNAKGWTQDSSSYWAEFRLRPFSNQSPPSASSYEQIASDEHATYTAPYLIIYYTPNPFTVSRNTDVPAKAITNNYTNATVMAIKVIDTHSGHKLKKIKIQNLGTMTTNDVKAVELWHDANGDFQYGSGDTLAATLRWDFVQYWTNNSMALNIDGADTNYVLTIDTTSHAYQGATFIASIPPNGAECSSNETAGGIQNNSAISISNTTQITQGTVVINEYQTRSSDPVQDRVELYNKTGSFVNLNGYQLVDVGGTVNKTFGASDIINPYGYLIAGGYAGFNNDNDLIVLRNATSMTIDRIDYSTAPNDNTSRQRKPNGKWSGLNVGADFSNNLKPTWGGNNNEYVGDLALDSGAYFTTNGTAYVRLYDPDVQGSGSKNINVKSTADTIGITLALAESNSPSGVFKSAFGFRTNASTATKIRVSDGDTVTLTYNDSTSPAYPVTTTALWKLAASPGDTAGDIVINEFQTDSGGDVSDAFELFNRTSSNISLAGWKIYDSILDDVYNLAGTLNASNYLYISGLSGWNNSDTIILKNASGVVVDRIPYPDNDPASSSSYGRKPNAKFSGLDAWTDFTNYSAPTWNANNNLSPGQLTLDKVIYTGTNDRALVTLADADIAGKGRTNVQVSSGTDPAGFNLILFESALGTFTNRFSFSTNATAGDRIKVTNNDSIYVKYMDKEPAGYSNVKSAVWKLSPSAGDTPGDAVINEFQTLSSDPISDTIEIFNRTASTIDLTGWKLKDTGGNTGYAFTETIQASNYILLSGLDEWNNDDDAVLLENALGVIIDKIAYAAAPASGSSLARKPNGIWSGTNVSADFQIDATPTFSWNNDSTEHLGSITANKLFYFTTSATCFVTLTDADNPASPVTNVKVTNTTLGSTNWFNLPLTGAAGTYTGKFTFSATSHDSNAKVMLVTNANSIRIDYTDANPSGIRDIYPVKWYSVLPPQVKFSEVDSRGRWANNTQMEFVELYNPAGTQVNLTNWKITLDGGATLVTLTGKIPPYGFYLCAATGVTDISGHAPDQTWSVGYKLTDTDYGLQLITSGDAYVDSAGWGSASGIQTGYYEGTPLGNVGSSEYITFERKAAAGSTAASMAPPLGSECDSGNAYDTENNLSDFVRQNIMNPKSSQAAQEPPPHTVTLTKNRDITNTAYRGNTNVTALPFRFTDGLDRIMKKIRVRNLGTTAASDLAMVKLYRDNDNDFAKSPGDTRVADLAWDGSTGWTNNDLTMAGAATNTNGNYLITVNIRTNAVFGRTFIARIAPGDVSCDLGVLNTADLINNGYILIDSRAPAIGSRLILSPSVVSNNNSQTFSLSALITNKGDGVVAKVYWYGHLTETNVYPTYTLSFKSGSTWSNGNLTIPKSVPPTNYILVLKASDLENYKSAYTNTLPLVLTVTGSFPPVIRSFTADKSTAVLNGTPDARIINFTTSATDRDTVMSNLTVILSNTPLALSGSMSNTGGGIWQAAVDFSSAPENNYILSTVVKDNSGYYSRQDLLITVRSNRSPVAAAGADQSVKGGATVLLDASASADPDSDPLSYSWEVITSPVSVILYNTTSMTASFVAPNVTGDIIVRLTVRDPWLFSSTAQVTVHVNKAFPADLSQARPYNTVIRPGEKEVRFLNLSQGTTITIYTITGHKAAEVPAGSESEAVWQVPGHLASGVYIVYMKDAAGHTKKLKIIRVK